MPRSTLFFRSEKASLFAVSSSKDELIKYYTLNDSDLSVI